MARSRKSSFVAWTILSFLFMSTTVGQAPLPERVEKHPLSFSLVPPAKPSKIGEPLGVHMTITNTSKSEIRYGHIRGDEVTTRNFHFEIRDSEGKLVEARESKSEGSLIVSSSTHTFKPGRVEDCDFDLAQLYQLNKAGDYTVNFEMNFLRKKATLVKSNTITVSIVE